jgi:L,D-peptidoglycan transpeptidase YkuD (ErfK/YbiS/YcfS/YnhG family)
VLGRGGIVVDKREGDGGTPVGRFPLRRLLYRPDRESAIATGLPILPAAHYNRLVRLPFGSRHERLWREDGLYDLVIELGYNDAPPVPGRGSAIFLHLARPDRTPTEGCVALARDDLLAALVAVGPESIIDINYL